MKPCLKYREEIALLAIDGLETHPNKNVRAHLDACAKCRSYLEEISGLAGVLREAEPKPEVEPSAFFHRRVRSSLAATGRPLDEAFLTRISRGWNWRWALSGAGTLALLIMAWFLVTPHPRPVVAAPARELARAEAPRKTDLEPTLRNYEMAVHQSFDSLDELLTAQGNRATHTPPVYTLAQFSRFNAAD
jgi:hypothetical protein